MTSSFMVYPRLDRKKEKIPFKERIAVAYLFPCCEWCSLVAGCIILGIVNLVIDELILIMLGLILSYPEYYYTPGTIWSENCVDEENLPGDPSDISLALTTYLDETMLVPELYTHCMYAITDFLIFIAISEKKEFLLRITIIVSVIRTLDYIHWFILGLCSCYKSEQRIFYSFCLIVLTGYGVVVQHSMLAEALRRERRLRGLEAEEQRALGYDAAVDPDDLDDMNMLRSMLSSTAPAHPVRQQSHPPRRVSLQLKPDIFEVHVGHRGRAAPAGAADGSPPESPAASVRSSIDSTIREPTDTVP